MKRRLALFMFTVIMAVNCIAEVRIGAFSYQNLVYGNDALSTYAANGVFPGFNGAGLSCRIVNALEDSDLEYGLALDLTGYGPGGFAQVGLGKVLFKSSVIDYRLTGDLGVFLASWAGGLAFGAEIRNEILVSVTENFGVGLLLGIQYRNYVFRPNYQNFVDLPIGLLLSLK